MEAVQVQTPRGIGRLRGDSREHLIQGLSAQVRLNPLVEVDLRTEGVVLARGRLHSLTTSNSGSRRVNNDAGGLDGAGRD